VRLHHSDEAEDGFKPTKNPLVFVRNAPAPAPNLANGKGYVYLKPGASRADFTAASRKAAAASTVVKNTSAAGGDYLPLSPGQFPYAIAQTSPNGKVTVKCVDPLKGTASEKIEAGH
jgi:hypothetical protein